MGQGVSKQMCLDGPDMPRWAKIMNKKKIYVSHVSMQVMQELPKR